MNLIKSENYLIGCVYWDANFGYFKFDVAGDTPQPAGVRLKFLTEQDRLSLPPSALEVGDAGLGASAFDRPSETSEWKDSSPAALVVAALLDLDRQGSIFQIRDRIESVIELRWDRWWRDARTHVFDQSFITSQPNKSLTLDSGFGISDVQDPNDISSTKKRQLTSSDRQRISKDAARDPSVLIEMPLGDFRRILAIVNDKEEINAFVSRASDVYFGADQSWAIFHAVTDQKYKETSSLKALERTLSSSNTGPQIGVRRSTDFHLPNERNARTLLNLMPSLLVTQQVSIANGDFNYLNSQVALLLKALVNAPIPRHESRANVLVTLLASCVRLSPSSLVLGLLSLKKSQRDLLEQNRIVERLFSPGQLTEEIAIGIWAKYVSDPSADVRSRHLLEIAAFGAEPSRAIADLASRLEISIVQATAFWATPDISALLVGAVSGSLPGQHSSELEGKLITRARNALQNDREPDDNSLESIIVRVISKISVSQRNTNRRIRSDLNAAQGDIEIATNQNQDLRNRLGQLLRQTSAQTSETTSDFELGVFKQFITSLQFVQAGSHKSTDPTRINESHRLSSELAQHLPIRSTGTIGEQVIFDPEIHEWKGRLSNRPSVGDSVVTISQGWLWKPKARQNEQVLAKSWCG